ncbi:MAG: hypothetical protein U5L45_18580 [Saprospiraceae bacterium]|nr:hypothetical protein [Saprospiraceae bacterium]
MAYLLILPRLGSYAAAKISKRKLLVLLLALLARGLSIYDFFCIKRNELLNKGAKIASNHLI